MYFDAPEKKCELRVEGGSVCLRSLGRSFWEEVIRKSRAQILSCVSNKQCDAYLLSESSLFVYDDKCLLITCGQTDLTEAILYLVTEIGKEKVRMLIYEREGILLSSQTALFI